MTAVKTTAEQLLLDACRDAEFRDKWIYPVGGAPHQNWLLQVYVPVPEDAKDRTPEGCLRAHLAAQPAPNPWREAVLDQLAAHCLDAPEDEPPASILKRIIDAAVMIALDPQVSSDAQALIDRGAAQPAPVPLTDTETHAELWKLAVRKGLVTVRSELIDPRNHGTRVSWMQGHDKACDISNDAAAHGIAASPEQPK